MSNFRINFLTFSEIPNNIEILIGVSYNTYMKNSKKYFTFTSIMDYHKILNKNVKLIKSYK